MSDQIAGLIKELVAGWNAHNLDKVTALYSDDFEEEEDVANKDVQRARRIWDLAGLLRAFGLLPELQ